VIKKITVSQSRETAFQSQIEDIKKKKNVRSFLSYLKIGKRIGGVMVSV